MERPLLTMSIGMCIIIVNYTHRGAVHEDQHRDRRQADGGGPPRDRSANQARSRGAGVEDPGPTEETRTAAQVSRQAQVARRPGADENGLMILVDSSVWIDFFNGRTTPETDYLDSLLGTEPVAVGDLILTEV